MEEVVDPYEQQESSYQSVSDIQKLNKRESVIRVNKKFGNENKKAKR